MNRTERLASGMVVAWQRMNWDRGFFVPKDVEVKQILPPGSDLDIRYWEKNGKLQGVAFAGKANKPLWNYLFRDVAQLQRQVNDTIESRKTHMEYKQKRMDERKNFSHTLKIGDILYSSWGYDQTNVDFYQVTAVGDKSVKMRPIEQKVVSGSQGYDNVVAVPDHFSGPDVLKRVGPNNVIRLNSYSSAYPWDGKPKYQTGFGYGH